MKKARRVLRSLMCVLLLVVSLVTSTTVAYAASDYDSFLHVSPTLYVYTDGTSKTQKMDISQTWWAEFKRAYAKRLVENPGEPTNFVTEFEDIVSSGGSWGVYMREDPNGDAITIVGTHDPSAHCAFVGSVSEGSYQCRTNPGYDLIRANYFTHYSYGNNGCWSWATYSSFCSDTGMAIYTMPTIQPPATSWYSIFDMPNAQLGDYRFFVMNFDLVYPTGYAGALIPIEPLPAAYVAMGDSYSAGEGNPPFEAGTDDNNVDKCHRSPRAYPRMVENTLSPGAIAFVACSGATTANVTGGQWNESPQTDALSGETQTVSLTIGGNDVGFPEYAQGCSVACGPNGPGAGLYNAMIDGITQPAFKANLINTYEEILQKAPNADLYVADYPYLATSSTTAYWGFDFSGAYTIQATLNGVIHDAVDEVHMSNSRIHFVETNYGGSPFENGELCGGTGPSLFSGPVAWPNTEYSFHPNAAGQTAYAEVFEEAMN